METDNDLVKDEPDAAWHDAAYEESSGRLLASLAGRILSGGGIATQGEVMALAAFVLSQYEK